MTSAWACVRSLFFTSSASVSPIAFCTAAFTWLWLLPRSLDRCDRKSLQTADAPVFWLTEAVSDAAGCGGEGGKPTFKTGAEGVRRDPPPGTRDAAAAETTTSHVRVLAHAGTTRP